VGPVDGGAVGAGVAVGEGVAVGLGVGESVGTALGAVEGAGIVRPPPPPQAAHKMPRAKIPSVRRVLEA
ncbi:MAG: hypothetical protein M3N19_01320, partial [Candidatus Eremiobacteraeota bacterium]|nr:hypothetical protein [Candidatus Eremiobacteraeota bacterium]